MLGKVEVKVEFHKVREKFFLLNIVNIVNVGRDRPWCLLLQVNTDIFILLAIRIFTYNPIGNNRKK